MTKGRALVVDDSKSVRLILSKTLGDLGWTVEQAGDGRRHELGIAEIEVPVGEGEPVRFGEQVNRLRGLRANVGQLEVREDAEHLLRRHTARRRQLRTTDAPRAIRRAKRRRHIGSIIGEVLRRHAARPNIVVAHFRGDRSSELARVQRLGTARRENAQRGRELGILQHVADDADQGAVVHDAERRSAAFLAASTTWPKVSLASLV